MNTGLTVLLAICALPAAVSWAAPGHLVTAALAMRNLPPDVAAAVAQDLLASSAANESFTSCAVWADSLKSSTHAFDAWHFIDMPITVHTGSGPPACPGPHVNVVWALEEAAATLRNRHSDAWARNFFLRIMVHLVGDIHQPLHTASLFSAGLPKGDEGGNAIKLLPPVRVGHSTATELHALWDAGCGGSGLESIRVEGDKVDMASVEDFAASLDGPDVARIAATQLADTAAVSDAFRAWADDSHAFASNASYAAPLLSDLGDGSSVRTDAPFWFSYASTGSSVARHSLRLGGAHLAQVVTSLYRSRAQAMQ